MITLGDTTSTGPAGVCFCRGCGCTDDPADPTHCPFFVLDLETPSGVCQRCAVALERNPVLVDTVGTDAMDDVSASLFAHLACARHWPPRPRLLEAA